MCLFFLVFNWATHQFVWSDLSLWFDYLLHSYITDDIIRLNKKQKHFQAQTSKRRLPVKGRFSQGKKIGPRAAVPPIRGQNVILLSPSKCIFLSNHVLTLKKAITNSCKIEFSFRLIPVFKCMQIRHVWEFFATGFVLAICRRCCEQTLHSKPQASSHGGQASWAGGHHWLSCEKKCCPV